MLFREFVEKLREEGRGRPFQDLGNALAEVFKDSPEMESEAEIGWCAALRTYAVSGINLPPEMGWKGILGSPSVLQRMWGYSASEFPRYARLDEGGFYLFVAKR